MDANLFIYESLVVPALLFERIFFDGKENVKPDW